MENEKIVHESFGQIQFVRTNSNGATFYGSELPQDHYITMESKLILENRTDLPMVDFLRLAQEVVSMGRISNDDKQYCYLTAFTIDGQEYHIVSDLNEKSDKLTFYKRPL